jgi:molybdopterin-guanine dinucleotide biosynthesis protein A
MDSVEGFILVGGASSRMGTDKSRLTLNGLTFTQRIAGALAQMTQSVKVVGRNDDLGLEGTTDIFEQWGALGGLHAALSACRTEWSLIVACDLPFVTTKLFARLAGFRQGFEAVVPVQQNGYVQPLCAFYRVDPCLERCEALIKDGERRPLALLEAVSSRRVEFSEISDLADADRFFDNINTPEDYVRATVKGGDLSEKG